VGMSVQSTCERPILLIHAGKCVFVFVLPNFPAFVKGGVRVFYFDKGYSQGFTGRRIAKADSFRRGARRFFRACARHFNEMSYFYSDNDFAGQYRSRFCKRRRFFSDRAFYRPFIRKNGIFHFKFGFFNIFLDFSL
jgi:hypothetical protein